MPSLCQSTSCASQAADTGTSGTAGSVSGIQLSGCGVLSTEDQASKGAVLDGQLNDMALAAKATISLENMGGQ